MCKPIRYLLLCCLILPVSLFAQDPVSDDTPIIAQDSVNTQELYDRATLVETDDSHSPRRATLYSAILPGLGQAYNEQYWKIPILYAGAGVIGYFINFNDQRYTEWRKCLFDELDGVPRPNNCEQLAQPGVSVDAIERQTAQWRRNRDLLIVVGILAYGLNILDAHVFAHLKEFEIDDDIGMRIKPSVNHNGYFASTGLSIVFELR